MTYSAFLAGLSALVVTGVVKRFTEPPAQLNSAQLPAQYVALPDGSASVATLEGSIDTLTITSELRIVIEALGQNMQSANWAKTTALIDALQVALVDAVDTLSLDEWRIGVQVNSIGDVAYWVIVASITGSF